MSLFWEFIFKLFLVIRYDLNNFSNYQVGTAEARFFTELGRTYWKVVKKYKKKYEEKRESKVTTRYVPASNCYVIVTRLRVA